MSGFRLRWSDLTKEGWRSRLPTGLSNSYTYLKPGKTKKDVRGVDYFVGEEELMKYLDRVDLEAAKDSQSDVSSAAKLHAHQHQTKIIPLVVKLQSLGKEIKPLLLVGFPQQLTPTWTTTTKPHLTESLCLLLCGMSLLT
ncbi:hypothetical protein F443_22763 [Phytophthora nicotianae P1569]|uniref:Uncharacterized protein n=1 Tax=Phytophthora nicotianae P1569 TaxID=1317065 RepID=V9DTZ4_PHYNI|nr:hypothetical protein F443_22763 [Phytophthora nicotianae P1569]